MLLTALLLSVAPWEGRIFVDPNPPDAEVFVDDERCASPCEVGTPTPGRHVILVRKTGYEHRTIEVTVSALDDRRFVHVELFPVQLDAEKNLRFAKNVRASGWALLGVSLATMATAGILELSLTSRLTERANAAAVPQDAPLADRARASDAAQAALQAQTATLGVAIAGGAILAAAVALLAFGPDPSAVEAKARVAPVSLRPIVGPTLGGAHAGFALGF
jgi:hypothetical protein